MAAEKPSPEEGQRGERSCRRECGRKETIRSWQKRSSIIANGKNRTRDGIRISVISSDQWQFCITLTKAIRGAVKRNYLKRILREVYRTSKTEAQQPLAVVFTVFRRPQNFTYNNVKKMYIETIKNA